MSNGASVYGGLRLQSLQAEAKSSGSWEPTPIDSNTDYSMGYLVGAAYERPDIALRVALTYHSETSHDLDLTEDNIAPTTPITSTQEVKLPQALNLEFQSGVADGHVGFRLDPLGRVVRNRDQSARLPAERRPVVPLVFFDDDRITYTLGVGRRLNDTWSVLGFGQLRGNYRQR